jgi:hypothetical protein
MTDIFKPLSTCSLQKTKLKNLKNNQFKSEYILKYYGTINCVYMYVQGTLSTFASSGYSFYAAIFMLKVLNKWSWQINDVLYFSFDIKANYNI